MGLEKPNLLLDLSFHLFPISVISVTYVHSFLQWIAVFILVQWQLHTHWRTQFVVVLFHAEFHHWLVYWEELNLLLERWCMSQNSLSNPVIAIYNESLSLCVYLFAYLFIYLRQGLAL
jgi:hypothetical protein